MKEILKQDYLAPISFEKQVAIIYVGERSFFNDIKVEDVRKFEAELLETIEAQKPEIFTKIKEQKVIDDNIKIELEKIARQVLRNYVPEGN